MQLKRKLLLEFIMWLVPKVVFKQVHRKSKKGQSIQVLGDQEIFLLEK